MSATKPNKVWSKYYSKLMVGAVFNRDLQIGKHLLIFHNSQKPGATLNFYQLQLTYRNI
ncbi:hypothetical protein D1AOALGA4SA_11045 [Olavius algarvensis Delta 1 endosymbiont]|nr:hypothetical protein D1AOALGA4SA_11045 [Olavius algarvensis Delta 1 endosymbiont]